VDPTQRDAVVLAVHEAAANAIEHAGATVTIRGARDEDRLIVVVSNEGRWTGSTPTDDLARGRGLTIMDGLMSKLEISRGAGRTTVRMRLDLENGSDT
jgi:anti-sigma regulatory factor (Ser/Thr protein kinase)